MNLLIDLQNWYASNCNTEWEHAFGIKIETLDNPGWRVIIDLEETNLEGKEFKKIKGETSDDSWVVCYVEGTKFHGFGDPNKFGEILRIFLDWAKSQNEDWLKPPDSMSAEECQRYADEQLYASLIDEVESEKCNRAGCTRNRIRNSVMCQDHHFEMVTKRPVPKRAN